jgi:hypothetical protein
VTVFAVKLGGPDQSHQAHLEQIVEAFPAAAGVVQGKGTDHGPVLLDAVIAAAAAGLGLVAGGWGHGLGG